MSKIIPVLLAGGAGTRLWPVSRDALPKQKDLPKEMGGSGMLLPE